MGSDMFKISTSNAIPWSQSYMLESLLYYQEIVEIQSKNLFLGPFLGIFDLYSLTPYELRPNFSLNKRSHQDT